ncbi:hypothetical protein [Nitrosopumilus sp.]|uniref:hypothetical protein n=1 Tax=Nitrosopumilus sp. TaxID=2024843 RepID=UPI00292FCABE|nr:hypothetical protein [Nitrosopumilus sp.]
MKTIKLQHRTYLGKDGNTKYVQHRINIPDDIIRKLDWTDADQLIISIESKINGKKKIILKSKN